MIRFSRQKWAKLNSSLRLVESRSVGLRPAVDEGWVRGGGTEVGVGGGDEVGGGRSDEGRCGGGRGDDCGREGDGGQARRGHGRIKQKERGTRIKVLNLIHI